MINKDTYLISNLKSADGHRQHFLNIQFNQSSVIKDSAYFLVLVIQMYYLGEGDLKIKTVCAI